MDTLSKPISGQSLQRFLTSVPCRVVNNEESNELDNDFLDFVYNVITYGDLAPCPDEYGDVDSPGNNEVMRLLGNIKTRLTDYDGVVLSKDLDAGVDVQGLVWDDDDQREQFLRIRRQKLKSFTSVPGSRVASNDDMNMFLEDELDCWQFKRFHKTPKPKLSHFQLRSSLLSINDKKQVFYNEMSPMNLCRETFPVIKKLDIFSGETDTVLELKNDTFDRVSSIDSDNDFLILGTLNGSYHIHNLNNKETTKKILTTSSVGIINFAKLLPSSNGILFSTNDGNLIDIDLHTLKPRSTTSFPWPVNFISLHPQDPSLKLIVGDNLHPYILDDRVSPRIPVSILPPHRDFAFTCDWSNDGLTLATGGQDSTVRLYDVRYLEREMCCMKGETDGRVCTVKFNGDSSMVAFSESVDYVNLVDLQSLDIESGSGSKQCISMFGKAVGAQFLNHDDEDGETLMIAVSDEAIGGILQYEMESVSKCLDYDFL